MVQSENILKVENLYVSYDNVNIVRNISFDLKKQEFLGIVGESGCGKTTLLRALTVSYTHLDVYKRQMLDVITQAQIWNLMLKEVTQRRLGLLMVTHNSNLAKRVCTRMVDLSEINHKEERTSM